MGRPLKKKYFGEPVGLDARLTLTKVLLDGMPAAGTDFWIIKQTGTGRFLVTNGTDTGVASLVANEPVNAGEATIEVLAAGVVVPEFARVVYDRTVKTFENGVYDWNSDGTGTAVLPFKDETSAGEEALEEVNTTTDPAALKTLFESKPEMFFTPEAKTAYDGIKGLNPELIANRQQSAAAGVAEHISLFGAFTTVEDMREVVAYQVATEANKAAFIFAVDSATTANTIKKAFVDTLGVVVADRADIIAKFLASDKDAAKARGVELESDDFTVVLKQLQDLIVADDANLNTIFADILAGRNELSDKKFFGTARMLPVIKEAIETQPE